MKGFRLRHVLFAAFTLIATVPVFCLGVWITRDALQREVSAVEEKHLLIARNMTAALDRYVRDTEAAFHVLARGAEGAISLKELAPLAQAFGYRHFCLIGKDGKISNILNLDNLSTTIPKSIILWAQKRAGPKVSFSVSIRKVVESYESDVIQRSCRQFEDKIDVDSRKSRFL
jgi:hypothetical protein